jgi:hypothetical protein
MVLRILIAFISLPGFVTFVLRSMPIVWRGRYRRMLCCWSACTAVHLGRSPLAELVKKISAATALLTGTCIVTHHTADCRHVPQ